MSRRAPESTVEEAAAEQTAAEPNVDAVREAIKAAFTAGTEAGHSEDQIKIAMIQAGSTFKGVSKDYAEFQVDAGIIDSKDTKDEKIGEILKGRDVSTEESFNEAVCLICEAVKGVNEKSAAGSIRYYTRKAELPCYTKPKGEGAGRTGFTSYYFDSLVANPAMTKEEAAAIVNGTGGHPETSDNTKRGLSYYQKIRRMANAIVGNTDDTDDTEVDENGEEEPVMG